MAKRTRSLASWTAVSGNPTMKKLGRPGAMSTSTCTSAVVGLDGALVRTLANMMRLSTEVIGVFKDQDVQLGHPL